MKIKLTLVLLILFLGIFLRFYRLGDIPNGVDIDEASQGYDAYSILQTGKDRYGQSFPIFMRSFGNYQSPLYTYFTVVPVYIFGLSVFSTRFISAMSGVIILACTFFLILNMNFLKKIEAAILAVLFMAISPWAVLFSRTAVEANLALAILVFSILLLVLSLKRYKWLFVAACFMLALSTYAYPAERVISVIFLGFFAWLFRGELFKNKKIFIAGVIIFLIVLIPQLILINSPGSKSRISQVQYWGNSYFQQNGGDLKNIFFGKYLFVARKFTAQYVAYFSPNNLFYYADEQVIRSMPDLSVFYFWMVVPFIFGIKFFLQQKSNLLIKIFLLILIISPIPAAVTREPFYTLRALPVFWVMTIMIAFGTVTVLDKLKLTYLRFPLVVLLTIFSLTLLYSSYFILLKYERMGSFGYYNMQLLNKLAEFNKNKIIVDSARSNLGMWYIFVKKLDPDKIQKQFAQYIQDGYYSSKPDKDDYRIDNIEFKPINFGTDICQGNIIIGDPLSISVQQAEDHKMRPIFQIKDSNDRIQFNGYLVDKGTKC